MEIKSAEEILNKHLYNSLKPENIYKTDPVLNAMKEYAAQFIELVAKEATHSVEIDWVDPYDYSAGHNGLKGDVDRESILELKEQLK